MFQIEVTEPRYDSDTCRWVSGTTTTQTFADFKAMRNALVHEYGVPMRDANASAGYYSFQGWKFTWGRPRCADCDAPAVAISATDGASPGNSPKPRCTRHALPTAKRWPTDTEIRANYKALTLAGNPDGVTVADLSRPLRICCTTFGTEAHEPGCTRQAPDTNAKTLADYRPGAVIKIQLDTISHMTEGDAAVYSFLTLLRVGVLTELKEQGVDPSPNTREALNTWITEYVHNARENR